MAAAATMFAACTQSDFVNEVSETEQAIGFETVANKITRADEKAENSGADYSDGLQAHHEAFTVWGHKFVSNEGISVFANTEVAHDGSNWSYVTADQPLVYWDNGATQYDFYAVAPVKAGFWKLNDNGTANTTNDDYFTTTTAFTVQAHNAASYATSETANVTTSFKGVAEDLMIAAPATVTTYASPVQLHFIHLLSRLNVNVTTGLDGIEIQSITVGNMNSTGSFNENATLLTGETLATGTYSRWNVDDAVISYTAGVKKLTASEKLIAIEALVMPQLAAVENVALNVVDFSSVDEPYLYVEYTLNGEEYKRAYNLADTFNETGDDDLAFNEGWQYTLNLSIGAEAITFTADVAKWADGDTGSQEIN